MISRREVVDIRVPMRLQDSPVSHNVAESDRLDPPGHGYMVGGRTVTVGDQSMTAHSFYG
jgi:hypothetical protein